MFKKPNRRQVLAGLTAPLAARALPQIAARIKTRWITALVRDPATGTMRIVERLIP